MRLTTKQIARYKRQLMLPEIGTKGQIKLLESRVLIIGLGGLGSASGFYLAAAGVGTLGLVDYDRVELSNLQRQILHQTASVGRMKVISARKTLKSLNPDITVRTYTKRLTRADAPAIMRSYDFIIDATDNFDSKFLIADLCHAAGKPYSHAGVERCFGQAITVIPGRTACLRCVFPETACPAPFEPRGPLGVVPGLMGTIQATEALKYLLGRGELLTNRCMTYDALSMRFHCVPVKRNPRCVLCGIRARGGCRAGSRA